VVIFDQSEALGELTVQWTGRDDGEIGVSDEFDEDDGIDHDIVTNQATDILAVQEITQEMVEAVE
jgi:segregation and condensation protein A